MPGMGSRRRDVWSMRVVLCLFCTRGGVRLGSTNYRVQLDIKDDAGDLSKLKANYASFCQGGVNVTLSPFGSTNTREASNITNSCGLFMVSSSASSPAVFSRGVTLLPALCSTLVASYFRHRAGFPYLFTGIVTLERFFPPITSKMAAQGYKRYALIYSTDSFCVGGVSFFTT
jgi:hypothetical protein